MFASVCPSVDQAPISRRTVHEDAPDDHEELVSSGF